MSIKPGLTMSYKIISLELYGYKRIKLTNIQRIKINMTEKIQLILGSNGSGKSSIMKELTPLPAVPAEYSKDGYKIIELQVGEKHYVLKSEFGGKAKHSFILNGENLNDGDGTAQIQKELVKKHFGITPDTHSLMLGETRFHSMSVSDRRYWFTQLSDTSYTFALSAYQKLKEQHRDTLGAIKMAQTRLAQEAQKLLSPEEEEQYRKQVKELTEFLHYLLTLTSPKSYQPDQLLQVAKNNLKQMEQATAHIKNICVSLSGHERPVSEDNLQTSINETTGVIRGLEYQISHLSEALSQEQELTRQLEASNVTSVAEIHKKLSELKEEQTKINSNITLPLVWNTKIVAECANALNAVSVSLADVVGQMQPDPDKLNNKTRYVYLVECVATLEAKLQALDDLQNKQAARRAELERLKKSHHLECPNCQHQWIQGFNSDEFVELCSEMEMRAVILTQNKTHLENLKKSVTEIENYQNSLKQIVALKKQWPILDPFWNYLIQSDVLIKDPKSVTGLLNVVMLDIQEYAKLADLEKQTEELMALKAKIAKNTEQDFEKLKSKTVKLENDLFAMQLKLSNHKTTLREQTKTLQSAQFLTESRHRLEKLMEDNEKLTSELIEAQRTQTLRQVIHVVQSDLSRKEQALSQMNVQKALVEDLQRQVKQYEEQAHVLKIAVRELSPTEGLIAKGMLGFINNFVSQINSFIRKIWLYPLELVPVLPDEDKNVDLDYKFSLKAGSYDNDVIPDIAKGSTAMKEVIDLAFRVVAMQYLGLQECPLLLDEFAASFDSAHRQAAYYAINNVMTQSNFSQLYIVSHYEQTYGSLKNAEMTVICPSNVVIPREAVFNQHVQIS